MGSSNSFNNTTTSSSNSSSSSSSSSLLSPSVRSQLRDYVQTIALSHYDSNVPFHNFQHASHVTMSASKLMNRIVMMNHHHHHQSNNNNNNDREIGEDDNDDNNIRVDEDFHRSTFGIGSD